MLVPERILVNRGFMPNRQVKGNISKNYNIIWIAKRRELHWTTRIRRWIKYKLSKEACWSELLEKWAWKSITWKRDWKTENLNTSNISVKWSYIIFANWQMLCSMISLFKKFSFVPVHHLNESLIIQNCMVTFCPG